MNRLELIGLEKLREHINNASGRVQDKEEGRQEHLRIFIKGDLEGALYVLKALEENNEQFYNK